jgi:predicted dehydrogenase
MQPTASSASASSHPRLDPTLPVRFGFIGAGAISHPSAQAVGRHPGGQVVAAHDTNAERLGDLCARHGIARACATAGEVFADPGVDAVYIAVPNKFHLPLTLEALAAGKHVMVEKPFALNYEEAEAAAEAARRAGLVLTVGMNQRFAEAPQKFRALVQRGYFGEVYHAKAAWLRRSGIPKLGTWFGSKDLAGGGCLYDIGVHLLDLCLWVMDNFEPVSVFGATYTKFGNRGLGEGKWGNSEKVNIAFEVEDFASGMVRFANGATVALDVTWAANLPQGNRQEVQIFGTEAGGSVFAQEIYRHDMSQQAWTTVDNPPVGDLVPMVDRFHNFIDHLHGKSELCVTLEQALVVQKILDAISESARTGASVQL